MTESSSVLEIRDLTVSYPCGFVLRPVNVRLNPGEILAVVGESGSGKSTLGLAAVNLLGRRARASGSVRICGEEVLHQSEAKLRRRRMQEFAMVFQNSREYLNPSTTLGEQLAEVLGRAGARPDAGQLSALMERAGLSGADLGRYPHELSGGMVQKFLMACAMALGPALIVLDEPTSALDAASTEAFCRLVAQLRREDGAAFLLITHDLALARKMADRVLVLYRGMACEEGPARQVLGAPRHPYTRGLIHASTDLFPLRDMWGIRAGTGETGAGCAFFGRCTQAVDACRDRAPGLAPVPGDGARKLACLRGGIVEVLSCAGIEKSFGRRRVLDGAELTLYHGEIAALVGPSGSGKSTLASILGGYLAPDAGTVRFCGAPADFDVLRRTRGGLQMIFQDSDEALDGGMTVLDAVREPGRLCRDGRGVTDSAVRGLLRDVGLGWDDGFLSRRVHSLSGGQRQRVNIARALSMEPALVIADEPTAMLDASGKANLMRLLKGLQNERGFSMLLITHELMLACKAADRVYRLTGGRLEQMDPAAGPDALR